MKKVISIVSKVYQIKSVEDDTWNIFKLKSMKKV